MKSLKDHEGYRASRETLDGLKARLADRQRAYSALVGGIQDNGETVTERASRLLAGDESPSLALEKRRHSHDEILQEMETLAEAIRLQRQEVTRQQEIASRDICKELAPTWQPMIQKIRKAAAELLKAGKECQGMMLDLERQGIFFNPPVTRQVSISDATLWKLESLIAEIDAA